MNESNFGNILREARERSGEDLMSVARKLRIRPDILESIEAGDLSNMPPRGYSRNMINAYARYLGLNPTNLVDAYLSQQYQDQVERARKNIRPTGGDLLRNMPGLAQPFDPSGQLCANLAGGKRRIARFLQEVGAKAMNRPIKAWSVWPGEVRFPVLESRAPVG